MTTPTQLRTDHNEQILNALQNNDNTYSKDQIQQLYTGRGGLHNLSKDDFTSFYAYTKAKQEYEQGQFFTPLSVCKKIVSLIDINKNDLICDPTCGIANFADYLPCPANFYGAEIDQKATTIAQYIYPNAHIETTDIRDYNPEVNFDIILGNPPFNLRWSVENRKVYSQVYFLEKTYELLKPGGIMLAIVPYSFLDDEFHHQKTIKYINTNFHFVGQYQLPKNAFQQLGVNNYKTKILILQKRCSYMKERDLFTNSFKSLNQIKDEINSLRSTYRDNTYFINKELLNNTDSYSYLIKKCLYELNTHPSIHHYYYQGLALVEELQNQKCPDTMDYEEWEKTKLTPYKVLLKLKKYVSFQNKPKEQHLIRLTKRKSGYYLKAYSKKTARKLADYDYRQFDYYKMFAHQYIESEFFKLANNGQRKEYLKKKNEYLKQTRYFEHLTIETDFKKFLEEFTFLGRHNKPSKFNTIQLSDICMSQPKRYSLLNWSPGSGKTPSAYSLSEYRHLNKQIQHTVITGPSIAIQGTWEPFLTQHKKKYLLVDSISKINQIPEYKYILITLDTLKTSFLYHNRASEEQIITYRSAFSKRLRPVLKGIQKNAMLLFDESDEITTYNGKKARSARHVFSHFKYKLLTTGTTTRNNINELYGQLQLLYNNSYNMISSNNLVYYRDKNNELQVKENEYKGKPFPAYKGNQLFKASFNPSKSTVFGIQKEEQHLFNTQHLNNIIKYTILTRSFKEIAGEGKYKIQTHSLIQSPPEIAVYKHIFENLEVLRKQFFNLDSNERKTAGQRILHQMNLLIMACSYPQQFDQYNNATKALSTKQHFILNQILQTDSQVAIGTLTHKSKEFYAQQLYQRDPFRPVFIIDGTQEVAKRKKIIKAFESTFNGILISTQQSLKSSVNIPSCNTCYVEALQWNIPKMEQYYRRFIRMDSTQPTTVHLVTYADTIEQNLLALLMSKEKLNEFIKTHHLQNDEDMFDNFNIAHDLYESIIKKTTDQDGHVQLNWGRNHYH